MPTTLGLVFVLLTAILTVQGRYYWAIGLALIAPVGVVATVADNGIPIFYFVGLGALAAVTFQFITGQNKQEPTGPGKQALTAFTVWSVIITALAPGLFPGIPVLISRGGIDNQLADPGDLEYTTSNLAQVAYLLIGVSIVLILARRKSLTLRFLDVGLGTLTALCFGRLVAINFGLPFPDGFFDNSTTVSYIERGSDGSERFRGIFAEPSDLAISSLVTVVYFVVRFTRLKLKFAAVGVILMASTNIYFSTATVAIAGGILAACALAAYGTYGFLFQHKKLNPSAALAGIVGLIIFIPFVPAMFSSLIAEVVDKFDSSSFNNRTGADLFSLGVLVDSWFLGVGVGSNRPSSFLTSLLSCVGIIGFILFVLACYKLIRAAWQAIEFRPAIWAFITLILSKSVAGPNLSDPLIWVLLGVIAHAAWRSDSTAGSGSVMTGASSKVARQAQQISKPSR